MASGPRRIGKIRHFTNIRKGGLPLSQHTFSFRAANAVFSDGRAAWHANCLEHFRLCK